MSLLFVPSYGYLTSRVLPKAIPLIPVLRIIFPFTVSPWEAGFLAGINGESFVDRRKFLESMGTVSAAGLLAVSSTREVTAVDQGLGKDSPNRPPKTWLFWDLWHLDRVTNLVLQQ